MTHQGEHTYKFPMEIRNGRKLLATYDGTETSYDSACSAINEARQIGTISQMRASAFLTALKNASCAIANEYYPDRYSDTFNDGGRDIMSEDRKLDLMVNRMSRDLQNFDLDAFAERQAEKESFLDNLAEELDLEDAQAESDKVGMPYTQSRKRKAA